MSLVNRRSPEITTWDLPAMMSLSVDIGLRSGQKHVEPLPRCQCRVQDLMMCGTYDETADQEQNPIDATERQNRPPVCARRRANDFIRRQPYTAPIPAPVIVVPGRFTRVVACQVDEQAKHNDPHDEAGCSCQFACRRPVTSKTYKMKSSGQAIKTYFSGGIRAREMAMLRAATTSA
jgi:hypothetical protein